MMSSFDPINLNFMNPSFSLDFQLLKSLDDFCLLLLGPIDLISNYGLMVLFFFFFFFSFGVESARECGKKKSNNGHGFEVKFSSSFSLFFSQEEQPPWLKDWRKA